jgi:predicted AlkP superfamily pyrophosphatase or phosphodiesterase
MTSFCRLVPLLAALVSCAHPSPGSPASTAHHGTVLLISIDGFRPDYLERVPAVNLRALVQRGVRAEWMTSAFPSKTYPAHYTIATGLWPEHHGIVGNSMWDSTIGYTFRMTDRESVRDPRWWSGEPIWVTAERQGRRAAAFMWPGTEAAIGGVQPTWWRPYSAEVAETTRLNQIFGWLTLPSDSAPVIVLTYFGSVDRKGHDFGPDSPELDSAISRVDSAVGALVAGLAFRSRRDVNLVIVSDHGMAALSPDRVIYLDDYLDLTRVRMIDWSPVAAIAPGKGIDAETIYHQLAGRHPRLMVYRRDQIPDRYHYRQHRRIAPVIAVADEGWMITSHERAPRALRERGSHGYDPAVPSMRAVFIAAGPAFRRGAVVAPFSAVHVYELLCAVLGLRPAANDGVLDSVKTVLGARARAGGAAGTGTSTRAISSPSSAPDPPRARSRGRHPRDRRSRLHGVPPRAAA